MGRFFCTFAVLLGFAAQAAAQQASPTPRALTERVVATYKSLYDPKVAKQARQSAAQWSVLDQYFDYDALSAAPFKSHQKKLTGPQLARLKKLFRTLLTQLTHNAGAQIGDGPVVVQNVRSVNDSCVVDLEVNRPEDDMASSVSLTWRKGQKGWLVTDVAFDGASVAKDYENQFGRILRKDGPSALENKLKDRVANLSKSAP